MNSHVLLQHDRVLDAPAEQDALRAPALQRAPVTPSERAAAPCVDEAEVLRRIDGDALLLEEIVELFETERRAMLGAIERAAAGADARALQREAHKLRGALLNLAARPAADAAYVVEKCGRTRSVVPREKLRDLAAELDGVSTALASLRPKTVRP